MAPFWRRTDSWPWLAGIAIACVLFAILNVSLQRTHFGIFAESDFTGEFGPEGQRILAGEPLQLNFHPPGYPFAAAFGRLVTGSWLAGGLWVSGISAMIFLVASFVAFRRLAGPAAAWGALIACAGSALFLSSASTAASDMLFAALVSLTLALVVQAMSAPHRLGLWLCIGILVACVILTRTNGVAAAIVVLAPFLVPLERAERMRSLGMVVLGLILPLIAWLLYATATGSPLAPSGTYLNLAVATYGEDSQAWGDRAAHIQPQFNNLIDVVAHDPAAFASRLVQRLLSLPGQLARSLTWPLLVALAVPGVLLMLWRRRTPALLLYLIAAASLTMLSGVVEFQPRYHLVLIPLLGAMAGATCNFLFERIPARPIVRPILSGAALLVIGVVSAKSIAPVVARLETSVQREIGEAIPEVLRQTEPNAKIYARKANLAFETGRRPVFLADVPSVPMLYRALCNEPGRDDPAYLYFGTMERNYRRELDKDLAAAKAIPWLDLIAKGVGAEWTLHRIRLNECNV